MSNDLIKSFKVKREKIVIINNPVDFSFVEQKVQSVNKNAAFHFDIQLLYVGGLRKIKRIELLIKTLELLPKKYFLTIVGGGDEYENIRDLINLLKLSGRIKIITDCKNPYPYYLQSDVLLLSSLFEGYPNVVLESFSCGCPVIGFDIKGGANEALTNYGGFIVTGKKLIDFADKIIMVCEKSSIDRDRIFEECKNKYDVKKIISEFEEVFV